MRYDVGMSPRRPASSSHLGEPTAASTGASTAAADTRLRVRDLLPLAGFVVPTVVIGYGFVIPSSPIAGVNEHTIGFGLTIMGACVTYVIGVRRALRR